MAPPWTPPCGNARAGGAREAHGEPRDGAPARPSGQVVVANLGVGAHDVVFGSAVLARAEAEGIGALVTI